MNIYFSEHYDEKERNNIINSLWAHNEAWAHVDIQAFILTLYDDNHALAGGLIGQMWWGALEIQYLWVAERERHKGQGKQLMIRAEKESRRRGCHMSYVDTFDFQALRFYEKLGYREYGKLGGYAGKFTRHYLAKNF